MNNYILIIGLILAIAGVGYGVMKLWSKEKSPFAIVFLCISLTLISAVIWAVLNFSAESTPPGSDNIAAASEAYIENLEHKEGEGDHKPLEELDYSEKNERENREAVEKFKVIVPVD